MTTAHPACHRVNTLVLLDPLVRIGVVLVELLYNVGAGVAKLLLDLLRDFELVLGWNDAVLAAVSEELLDEEGDVSTGDGDVLDG